MSVLDDIYNANNVLDSFESIRTPEDLQQTIQGGKDIFDKYITDLKNIPAELERWQNVAKELGVLSDNTDYVNEAKDLLFKNAFDNSQGVIKEGIGGLKNILSEKDNLLNQKIDVYSIAGIKIDGVYNPNPTFETYTYSQPIVSSENVDNLSEHAENTNPILTIKCVLRGEDRQTRLDNLNKIRESKKIIQVIVNKVYDKMLITKIKPNYTNSTNDLEFTIELENVFVAQLKRVVNKKQISKQPNLAKRELTGKDPFIKNLETLTQEDPIPQQQKALPSMVDMVKTPAYIGNITPLAYEKTNPNRYVWGVKNITSTSNKNKVGAL